MARPSGGGGFSVKVDGLRELRRDLKAIDRKLPAELNRRLKVAAEPVRREAAALAPRRTGALRASLKVRTAGSKLYVGSRLPYARIVHWGGRHPLFGNRDRWYAQKPRPFLQQAVTRQGAGVERAVFDTVERLMRDAGFH